MSTFEPIQWDPDEKPLLPGSPSTPNHPPWLRVCFLLVGILVNITGGLGNALVTVNLIALQGSLAAYSNEVAWLPAAYIMSNVSMNLLLVKFRQQFGLRLFTEFFLTLYALVTFAHLFVHDFVSAIAVRAAHGMAGAALSTLGLYYTLQAFPKVIRPRGIVVAVGVTQLALPLAYVFSTELLEFAEWRGLYLFELGLSLVALGCVLLLKLPPGDRIRAFEKLDFLTFALFAPGMALLCAVLTFGRLQWWFDMAWIGWALAGAIILITAAICIEHNRTRPLLNTRWLASGDIARLVLSMILIRVVLSEQGTGAVGYLRAVGLNNDQMTTLFAIVLVASIAGVLLSAVTLSAQHLSAPVVIALLCMAAGAFLDSRATSLTRPEQMYLSQALLGFGGALFIGPSVIALIGGVIANPANLISFSVVFGLSQNLGGLIGAAALGTFQTVREKFHSSVLVEQLSQLDPLVAARIQSGAAAYGRLLPDPAARTGRSLASLGASATREANVLAYNDVFLLIACIALATAAWIFLHAVWRKVHGPPPAPPPAPTPATTIEQVKDS